jgi:hypothetical protein
MAPVLDPTFIHFNPAQQSYWRCAGAFRQRKVRTAKGFSIAVFTPKSHYVGTLRLHEFLDIVAFLDYL